MAVDVETVDTVSAEAMSRNGQDTQGWHVELPDFDDAEAVERFLGELDNHLKIRGVKTLRRYAGKYLDARQLAERHMQQVQTSLDTVNGTRTSPRVYDENRKFRAAVKRYLNALNTPELRKQCELFGIQYNNFETQQEIIEVLLEKNMAMRGQ